MFKNFKTWLVLFLLVVNTHADETMESGGSDASDSSDSEGSPESSSFEKPLGKSAENQRNEASNVMKCQESNPTNACTCPLTTSLKNQCLVGLNPCQQALFLQWAQQVETTVLVQVSLSTAQLSVAFAYSYQSFAKLYPDIDVVTRNCQIKPFGLNQLILGDFQNIALSFADETCGSAFNLDQNNNTSLFDGLRQAASNCGVGTTGSTVSGATGTGSTVTGATATGSTATGATGSTVSGATATGTAGTGSTPSGPTVTGTGMPAVCAGYYTSPGTPSTGSTVSGPTGTAGTGSTVSGSTGTGSTVSGSTGTAGTGSTVSGSTGTAGTGSTISGPTGTAGTGSTPTAPTGSTGTGATTVSGGTVAPSCTGITVAVNILIQNLLVIFQQTTLTYEQMMIQISITLQGWFAQYPQFQQTIMSQQISGFFSIQVLVDVSFKYQQSSMISNIFSGDVTTCPVLVAIKNAYSQPVCGATTGTTATGSTGTATGSTGTATGSTGTATGSTGTATGSTGSTATGSTGTATATGSTPAGTTAGATGATTGSTSSGATSGTTSASSGNCIPLDIQQKLQAFYDLLVIQFQTVTDTNQRLQIFSNIYYQFTKDVPSCVPFLRWIKISGFGSINDIIFISGVITFPQVNNNGIDALINNTNGWNNTIFVQSMYTYTANLNVTYSFQGFSVSAVQWSMWRNIYITGNISLIISNINMSYRQKHVQIHGVLNGFFTKYTNQNVFYCMPIGNFGTLADWSQAVRVSPAWTCPIPHGCFQPRNNLINIKSDNSTHFTTGWNNMVATLSPSDQSCVSSFTAQINAIIYGSVPSGGQVVQIYQLTIQITAAKSACPNAASSIDGCLVGKWGHLKKFVDCQINASTTQYMSK